jgi:hypothetical protein
MNKVFNYLKSRDLALLLAFVSMLVQSPHSFSAFYNLGGFANNWGIAQAILFAVIVDFSILFYTARGRNDIAYVGAFVMVVINCYHYYTIWGLSWTFGFGCFLALIVPVSVYYYSEEIPEEDGDISEDAKLSIAHSAKEAFRMRCEELSESIADRDKHMTKMSLTISDLQAKERVNKTRIERLWEDNAELTRRLEKNPPEDKSILNIEDHSQDATKYGAYNPISTGGPDLEI